MMNTCKALGCCLAHTKHVIYVTDFSGSVIITKTFLGIDRMG